jgi:hypothetical protein
VSFSINLSYVSNGAAAFGKRERITIFSVALRRFLCEKRIGIGLLPWVFVSFLPSKKKISNKIYFFD